jgi:hypothetical protein
MTGIGPIPARQVSGAGSSKADIRKFGGESKDPNRFRYRYK